MYNSQIMANRVRELARTNNISIKDLMKECGLGENALSQAAKSEGGMKAKNLYAIAEILHCSVDYLLGRSDSLQSEISVKSNDNHGLNMGINTVEFAVPVTVAQETQLDENQQELLKRFRQLTYKEKLNFMQELVEKTEGNE